VDYTIDTSESEYPTRTALSKMVVNVLADVFAGQPVWHALNAFSLIWYLIVVIPLFFGMVAFGRKDAPELAVQQVNTVRLLMSEAGLSAAQRQIIWRSVIDKYIDAVGPDLSRQPALTDAYPRTVNELGGDGAHPLSS
jgi:hypothetical protein